MKKMMIIVCFFITGTVFVWAGPPHGCPGGWYRPPPPPCPGYWGGGWGCNRDLANAAAITSIVANGVSILGNLSTPRYVTPAPVVVQQSVVVQQPVVVPQPVVVQQPVVVPQPVVVAPARPVYVPTVQYYY